MENRFTKKRLSNFLAYEWIAIIIVSAVVVIVMELLFTFGSIRILNGQRFTYFYDQHVSGISDDSFAATMNFKKTFSYDIRVVNGEQLSGEASTLMTRVSTGQANVIFTDTVVRTTAAETSARVKKIIDSFGGYTFESRNNEGSILFYANEYLKNFLAVDKQDENAFDYANLSEQKIAANYKNRINARIYRNDEKAGLISVKDEYARIKKLCEDATYLEKVIEYDNQRVEGGQETIFYSYKRYTEYVENGGKKPSGYDEDTEKKYGLNLSRIGAEAQNVFFLNNPAEEGSVIALMFNLGNVYGDLKFECISFIDGIIKNYADFADNIL